MKKILIVTYRYPPQNTMGARRWAEMIPFLLLKYDVYVFTTSSDGDLKSVLDEEKICRTSFIENELFNKEFTPNVFHRLVSLFTHEIRTIDSTWISWYYRNKKQFLDFYFEVSPNYLITTVGPYSSALFGKLVKQKSVKCKWILDIRDPASQYHEYKKNFIHQYFDEQLDKFICSKSDLKIATVGNVTKDKLEHLYCDEIHQIFNGFSKLEQISLTPNKQKSEELILYYAGRIYEHRLDGLYLLIRAIQEHNVILSIRLLGTKQDFEKIRDYLIENNINNVRLLKPTDSSTVLKETSKADIAILIESISVNSESDLGVLPGKLFELLNCKVPIMAICSFKSHIKNILKETNRGKVVNSIDGISSFLNNYKNYTLKDLHQIEQYSREFQTNKFIRLLRESFEE